MRVATHASDIDGIVSAALILMKFPNAKIDFLTLRDLKIMENVEYDLIIDLPKLPNAKANVDHHISNYESLKRNGLLTEHDLIDPKAPSSASLLIKYLGLENNPKAKKLVEFANIADTGGVNKKIYILDKIIKCHSNEPDILLKIAWILVEKGLNFTKDKWLVNEWKRLQIWLKKGRKISDKVVKEALKKDIKYLIVDLISGFPRITISDLQWMYINSGGEVIVVINRMTDPDPACPKIVSNSSKEYARVSIRVSRNCSFDARKLAEKLGGGGHVKASGARIKINEYYSALSIIINALADHGIVGYTKIDLNFRK